MRTVTISQIAREEDIKPSIARRRLRRLGDKVPKTVDDKHWVFKKSDARRVKELIIK